MKSPARLLIVEDERIVALDIKNQLVQMGFPPPLLAASADEAVAMALEHRPDLILMDITLSEGMSEGVSESPSDGISAATRINAVSDVPIIFVTAQADEETVQRVKATEMYGYILKPIYFRELALAIEFALHKHQASRRLKEQRKWLVTTITGIGDGIITTDQDNRIMLMNPAAEAMTGWTEAEARGRDLPDVYITFDRSVPDSGAAFVWGSDDVSTRKGQTMLASRNGRARPVQISMWELKTDDGAPMGRVVVIKDVSQGERIEWNMPPKTM